MATWQEIARENRDAMERIVCEVSEQTGVPVSAIYGIRRTRNVVTARHLAIWRARKELRLSLPAIGRHFKRDHTSILNAVARIDDKMAALK